MNAAFASAFVMNFMFWTGTAAGAVAFAALLDLTGGEWAGPVRVAALRFTWVLPAATIVFLVLLFGARALYPWIDHPTGSAWLRFGPFVLRDVATLLLLSVAAIWFATTASTPSAVVFVIAFAIGFSMLVIDLIMSIAAPWGSTLFPAYVCTSSLYAAIAASAIAAAWTEPDPAVTDQRANDLGRLLCGFALLWMSLVWSQFLVIWYGNLSEEVGYVMRIVYGRWKVLAWAVWTARFLVPFAAFLTPFGRRPAIVVGVGLIVIAGFWAEIGLLVVSAAPAAPSIVATLLMIIMFAAVFATIVLSKRVGSARVVKRALLL